MIIFIIHNDNSCTQIRIYTALGASLMHIRPMKKRNPFASWFCTVTLFLKPEFMELSSHERNIYGAHTHTVRSFARSLILPFSLSLFLCLYPKPFQVVSSQVTSDFPNASCSNIFLVPFYKEHQILLNCNKKWHIYKYCYGYGHLRHLNASAHTRWRSRKAKREKRQQQQQQRRRLD